MSEKPKKTLSPEQLKKMQEGRKRAYEKRKSEREAAKQASKEKTQAKKDNDKEKLLQLEMEAMKQQQDRIDHLKLQVERKREVKAKLKSIKEDVEDEPDDADQEYVPEVIEEELINDVANKVAEEVEEVLEKVEEKVEKKEEKSVSWSNEEYTEVFQREANKMRAKIPKEVQHYYTDAVRKFDFSLSLDDNIQNMINYVSSVVKKNAETVSEVRKVQKNIEDKQELVQKQEPEIQMEKELQSQINKLIKMKY
jgi:hypothetical protein